MQILNKNATCGVLLGLLCTASSFAADESCTDAKKQLVASIDVLCNNSPSLDDSRFVNCGGDHARLAEQTMAAAATSSSRSPASVSTLRSRVANIDRSIADWNPNPTKTPEHNLFQLAYRKFSRCLGAAALASAERESEQKLAQETVISPPSQNAAPEQSPANGAAQTVATVLGAYLASRNSNSQPAILSVQEGSARSGTGTHYLENVGPRCITTRTTRPRWLEFRNNCAETVHVYWQAKDNLAKDPSMSPGDSAEIGPGQVYETFESEVSYMACPAVYNGRPTYREKWVCTYK